MTLEAELVALSGDLAVPDAPLLAERVQAGIARPPKRSRRRWLVGGLMAAAAIAGTAPVVASRLGTKGVEIEQGKRPTPGVGTALDLGQPVTLAEARRRVRFPVAVLRDRDAEAVFLDERVPGSQVSLRYRDNVLLTQFAGEAFVKKIVSDETRVEPVAIDGRDGYWISGAPHELFYNDADGNFRTDRVRLAGNVLLWERGEVTLRLEGVADKAEAVRLASAAS